MVNKMKMLSYCMVIGDAQKYLTMLVSLRVEVSLYEVTYILYTYVLVKYMYASPVRECKMYRCTLSACVCIHICIG